MAMAIEWAWCASCPDTWFSSADAVISRRDVKTAGRLSLQVVVVGYLQDFRDGRVRRVMGGSKYQ